MQAIKQVFENLSDETLRAVIQHPDELSSNQILKLVDNKTEEVQIAIVNLVVYVLEKCSLATIFEEFAKTVSDNIDICNTVTASFKELKKPKIQFKKFTNLIVNARAYAPHEV